MAVPDGYVLVDKPVGISSFSAVQAVRRALGIGGRRGRKAGHAGTLDPFATGLLVITIGHATRLMPWLVGHDKRYLLRVALGATSTTDDVAGDVTPTGASLPEGAAVRAAVAECLGLTEQRPPAVSAIHVDGERAYKRVRRGEELEMAPRPVRYDTLEVLAVEPGGDGCLDVVLDVRCATGTYMRSRARDLGAALGCGGYARELRRLEVGGWSVEGAPAPDAVRPAHVRPSSELVAGHPAARLTAPEAVSFAYGQRVQADLQDQPGDELAVLAPDGSLIGIGTVGDAGSLRPRAVFTTPAALGATAPAVVAGSAEEGS